MSTTSTALNRNQVMNGKTPDNRLAGLARSSQKKQQEALSKTKQAVDNLIQNRKKITVSSVAREAGVSISYIYKYPELAYEIQSLRDSQKYSLLEQKYSGIAEQNNTNSIVKNKKVFSEETEELDLSINNEKSKNKSKNELYKENIELQIENQKLKQKLDFTRQQLAEIREFILSQGGNYTQDKFK